MGPTRFNQGKALGFVNQFNYRSTTANLISQSDTTPDVTLGELFYTNNTTTTVITNFDLQDYANRSANYEGKTITVWFLDTATSVANGGRLFLQGSDDLAGSNHSITLLHSRSAWYELSRSKPNQNGGVVTATMGNSGALAVTRDTQVVFAIGTVTPVIIAGISGQSYIGQRLVVALNSEGISYQVKSDAAIAIAGTNAIVYTAPRNIEFMRVAGSWQLFRSNL